MNIPLTVLAVIDGFGYSPQEFGNAIMAAKTPNLDMFWSNYPKFLLKAAEEEVGLAFGEIGNSEVGHIAIGTGRVIPQSLSLINQSIEDKSFFNNPAFNQVINQVKQYQSRLHLLGIISTSGVHGHLYHYLSAIKMAAQSGVKEVYLHLILDGRDAGPKDSPFFIREINNTIKETGVGTYASMCGRGFTMDRNNNWERTKKGYDVLFGRAEHRFENPEAALEHFYGQEMDDENMPAITIGKKDQAPVTLQENDGIIITNFREDRARQITKALSLPGFKDFPRENHPQKLFIATMTSYEKALPVEVGFPPPTIYNTFSDVLSKNQITQIHISESEKYAHVTYFFNGGRESKAPLEEYYMVPSLKPEEFEIKPEMSAEGVTQAVLQAIKLGYKSIVFNFANCDMVGHTGNFESTVKAIEIVDACFKPIWEAISELNGYLFITADHGNCEIKIDPKTNTSLKEHTISPVPFMIVNNSLANMTGKIQKVMVNGTVSGLLSDVTPTILNVIGIPTPSEMTGTSLL